MKYTSTLGLTACLAALTTFTLAQPDVAPDDSTHRPSVHPADANDDGMVTSEEFAKFQNDLFTKSDANQDGQLDREEVLSIRKNMPGREGRIPPTPGPEWRSGKKRGDRHSRRNPEHIFGTLDENEDGVLQGSELPAGMAQQFTRLDADSNGSITLEEFQQARPDREKMKSRFKERFNAMDSNGDGMIQEEEAAGPMQTHFSQMDANSDGAIDSSEIKALREKFHHRDREKDSHAPRNHTENGMTDSTPASQPTETP